MNLHTHVREKTLPLLLLLLCFCGNGRSEQPPPGKVTASAKKRVADLPVPEGYMVDSFPAESFSTFVQNLVLKDKPVIFDYSGKPVVNPIYRVAAVIDLPLLFASDLEQCADFAMRIWADYHLKTDRMDSLYLFSYGGEKKRYRKDHDSYRNFLKQAFSTSNSYSLKKGCRQIGAEQLRPGDLVVQNSDGGIGHVSMIMNSCHSAGGEKLFLIGFSFMPAQEFHIEDAMKYGTSGWFTVGGYVEFLKNHLDLGIPVFRRFY